MWTPTPTLLPGESAEFYQHYVSEHIRIFGGFAVCHSTGEDALNRITELADLRWRLRRTQTFEAKVLDYEIHAIRNNPDLAIAEISELTPPQLEGLAYIRLVERKVLPAIYAQETRLNRRIEKTMKALLDAEPALPPATSMIPAASERTAPVAPLRQPETPPHAAAAQEAEAAEEAAAPENCKNEPIHSQKVGRNEPCPCGSSLKYKRCCGNPVPMANNTRTAAAA